jgi:hypothetical protein
MKLDIESGEQFSSSFSSKSRIKQAKMKLWTPFMIGTALRPLQCQRLMPIACLKALLEDL